MIDINSVPIMMTVLDSEGYKTSRDRVQPITIEYASSSLQAVAQQSEPDSSHQSVVTNGGSSPLLERLREELDRKSSELGECRRELVSAEKTLTHLRHNYVYEVKILKKTIADLQRGTHGKSAAVEPSVMKEYSQLLVEREKLRHLHEADTATIKELKQAYASLMSQKSKRSTRTQSKSPQGIARRECSDRSGLDSSPNRIRAIPYPPIQPTTNLTCQSHLIVSISSNVLQDFYSQTAPAVLLIESLNSVTCDPKCPETRHVAIMSRQIDAGHAVCQTENRGTDVSCGVEGITDSPQEDSGNTETNGESSADQTTVQYIKSNALEESFYYMSLIEHE